MFNRQDLRGRPHLERIPPSAAWYFPSSVFGFSALRAEKPNTNRNQVPLCRRLKNADCVSRGSIAQYLGLTKYEGQKYASFDTDLLPRKPTRFHYTGLRPPYIQRSVIFSHTNGDDIAISAAISPMV